MSAPDEPAPLSGCVIVLPEISQQPTLHNPYPELCKVAVAPFFNLTTEPTLDGRQFALAYFNELQLVPGFEVVPVEARRAGDEEPHIPLAGPDDARRLAQLLQVDAVVIGAVTDYSPYYPPRLRCRWNGTRPTRDFTRFRRAMACLGGRRRSSIFRGRWCSRPNGAGQGTNEDAGPPNPRRGRRGFRVRVQGSEASERAVTSRAARRVPKPPEPRTLNPDFPTPPTGPTPAVSFRRRRARSAPRVARRTARSCGTPGLQRPGFTVHRGAAKLSLLPGRCPIWGVAELPAAKRRLHSFLLPHARLGDAHRPRRGGRKPSRVAVAGSPIRSNQDADACRLPD